MDIIEGRQTYINPEIQKVIYNGLPDEK